VSLEYNYKCQSDFSEEKEKMLCAVVYESWIFKMHRKFMNFQILRFFFVLFLTIDFDQMMI